MPARIKPSCINLALRRRLGIKAGSKYGAVKTTVGGIPFDSKAEAKRYGDLLLLERHGKIRALELQPSFPITIKGVKVFTYRADFAYERDGQTVVEDVKGVRTPVYKLKKRCVEAEYGVQIREVK